MADDKKRLREMAEYWRERALTAEGKLESSKPVDSVKK